MIRNLIDNVICVEALALVESSNIDILKQALTITSTGKTPFTLKLYKESDETFQIWIPRALVSYSETKIKKNPNWISNFSTNIELRPEQKKIVNSYFDAINSYSPFGGCISSSTGCVDADTEFLTPSGWKRIADYKKKDLVAQYNLDGTINFIKPNSFIKIPEKHLWHFKTKYGLNQCLSLEHKVLYKTKNNILRTKDFIDVFYAHNRNKYGFMGKFITTFKPKINTKLNFTNDQLRVLVAVIADGHFVNWNKKGCISETTRCTFRLKKQRKINRLKKLLEKANIKFSERLDQSRTGKGFYVIHTNAPLRIKEFDERFFRCSINQLEIIANEVLFWDGNQKNQFYTTSKKSADFIQYVFTSLGYRASIIKDLRKNKYKNGKISYKVHRTKITEISLKKHNNIKKYKTKDGYQYCFSVPSNFLVLRRNNCIFITGNSGKTCIAIYIASKLQLKTLVIVPTTRLLDQWKERILEFTDCKETDIGIIKQNKCEVENKKFVIGMLHSLAMRDYSKNIYNNFGFICVDEVSRIGSEVLSKAVMKFNSLYTCALSATPRRKDGMENVFKWFLGDIIAESTKQTTMPKIYLIPYRNNDVRHENCIGRYGKFKEELITGKYLNKLALSKSRTELIGQILEKLYYNTKNILVLSDRLLILQNLKRYLLWKNVPEKDIGLFTGNLKELNRRILLGTYGSASLGFDDPNIDTILLATPRVDIEQACGRLRGKGLIIDIVDTASSIMRGWSFARLKYYNKISNNIINKAYI